MDLFPDGGFVRLRSRARDKYVHADEDASGVSLRPLGAVASRNVAWEVKLWPVEGVTFLLLQGAAYGRYLAVSSEDEHAPSGHRGVRAVQRDFNSLHLEDPFKWLAIRVEAGQNYVRLHNDQRCLRSNGRHRNWNNNVVTVDVWNGSRATMMQWRVEAIPSTPEALPLPPPPPPQPPCKQGSCCGCGREGSGSLCRRCAGLFRATLLDVAKKRLEKERGQRHCYCLECREIFAGSHSEHHDRSIPFGSYKNQFVAWAAGEEPWRTIFERIETQDRGIKPYLLYKSGCPRCPVCRDIVTTDPLYGSIEFNLCSLECFVTGGGDQETTVESAIVATEYSRDTIGFCLTCAAAICLGEVKSHSSHNWLRVRTDAGLRPRVIIPDHHPKEKTWAMIRKEGPADKEVLIRDDTTARCKECGKRLSVGDCCSLQCSLDATCREPRFLPRSLQLRTSLGARAKIA